ncbi:MAG: hypothetical protein ACLRWQ_09810 [Flavonifractor plautii]
MGYQSITLPEGHTWQSYTKVPAGYAAPSGCRTIM